MVLSVRSKKGREGRPAQKWMKSSETPKKSRLAYIANLAVYNRGGGSLKIWRGLVKFKHSEKATKIWKNYPFCFDVTK